MKLFLCVLGLSVLALALALIFPIHRQQRHPQTDWGLTWSWDNTNRPVAIHHILRASQTVETFPIDYTKKEAGIILQPEPVVNWITLSAPPQPELNDYDKHGVFWAGSPVSMFGTQDMSIQIGFTTSNTFIWRRLNKEQVENLENRRQ